MFINIGYGNYVNSDQIVSISRLDSAPVKRLVQEAKESGKVVDGTQGRKTKAAILTVSGAIVLSALLPDTIAARAGAISEENGGKDEA